MIKNIVFATNNQHKLKELREIVGDKFNILSLADIKCFDEITETANSFDGNALMKARYVKDKYGYDCFADDSGLEINALDNAPGVYSARFAGNECDSEKNISKVFTLLGNCPDRKARFVTVFALIMDKNIKYFRGEIAGNINKEKKGSEGFGYDPIFVPEDYEETFAQMPAELKNKISHRAIASQKLIEYLKSL